MSTNRLSDKVPPGLPETTMGSEAVAGPAVKRRVSRVDWIVRGLVSAIVVVLIWYANFAPAVQIAYVVPQLAPSAYVGLFVVTVAGHVDHGSVPLQVTGTLNEAGSFLAALELDTRPAGESHWQDQPACCAIAGTSFTGSASLPVAAAQAFDFQLVPGGGDNTVLATGTLAVHTEAFAGGSQLAINIIGGLGAIATVLEFVRLWLGRRTTAESTSSRMQGEPDA